MLITCDMEQPMCAFSIGTFRKRRIPSLVPILLRNRWDFNDDACVSGPNTQEFRYINT